MRAENIRLVKVITAKSMVLLCVQMSISPQPLSRIEILLESVWHLIVATKAQIGVWVAPIVLA